MGMYIEINDLDLLYSQTFPSVQEARKRGERAPKLHQNMQKSKRRLSTSERRGNAAMYNARNGDKFQGEESRKMILKI